VARARFLDEIETDGSPDNVLMIRELLKPTFDPERLDRRVDWEQMDLAGARHWLRRRLDGLKRSAWKEEQQRKNGEQPYEEENQLVEAITSDVPEL
jgi:DNA-directed RNA polymerase specialized sigma24 family protein